MFIFFVLFTQHYYINLKNSIMSYITKAVSNYRGTQPLFGKLLVGFGGGSLVFSVWSFLQAKGA
jgi:hypothetical protein